MKKEGIYKLSAAIFAAVGLVTGIVSSVLVWLPGIIIGGVLFGGSIFFAAIIAYLFADPLKDPEKEEEDIQAAEDWYEAPSYLDDG